MGEVSKYIMICRLLCRKFLPWTDIKKRTKTRAG